MRAEGAKCNPFCAKFNFLSKYVVSILIRHLDKELRLIYYPTPPIFVIFDHFLIDFGPLVKKIEEPGPCTIHFLKGLYMVVIGKI